MSLTLRVLLLVPVVLLLSAVTPRAQDPRGPLPPPPRVEPPATRFFYPTGPSTFVPLPKGPSVFDTDKAKIRVVTLVNGLSRPFAFTFLPDGAILLTEKSGQLRLIRDGVLVPQPISGVPETVGRLYDGLQDVALHPQFAENRWVYLTYTKRSPENTYALTLARGRLDGMALTEVKDLFTAEKWNEAGLLPVLASRIVFGRDGKLYMSVAAPVPASDRAQDPSNHQGKVLRLNDDGTVPPDNPFVGKPGYKAEIFTMGHRNILGLAVHPATGALFGNENGPQGGDEINILQAGKNYGWPLASQGRDYSGRPYKTHAEVPGMEPPQIYWNPAISISGMTFYTGDRFPRWKNDVFVGSLAYAHLERITFNAKGEHTNREWLLLDLKQRIRDVHQGPDGYLYVLTDAAYGALLRLEPAP